MPLRQTYEVVLLNEAQRSYVFEKFAHCILCIFAHVLRRDMLSPIHATWFFYVLGTRTGSRFRWGFRFFSFFGLVSTYVVPFFLVLERFKPSLGSVDQVAKNSSNVSSYKYVIAVSKSCLINSLSSLSLLATRTSGRCSRMICTKLINRLWNRSKEHCNTVFLT